ncbi:MAG: RNA pseudouridine synthase [Tidjanibacter sp.]|nr:RNA pseudouridine synthase [Tidjanibacter sp.]
MFDPQNILYEDNHILVVNKHCGELVQSDTEGTAGLEDDLKAFIKVRDHKPGGVFLGVVHRIDRPVSGAVMFAKTSKSLVRLNEMIRNRQITKRYWAVVENNPPETEQTLVHYMTRDSNANRAYCSTTERPESKRAELRYRTLCKSTNYTLLEVELITGRHHQIRCQLSAVGCPVKGDLKYGARRSNPGGGISLHSRSIEFVHPVSKEPIRIIAPVPADDNLWTFFENSVGK